MHYYGMGKSEIDEMNDIEIQGWLAMIPDVQQKFGEVKVEEQGTPGFLENINR